MTTIVTYATIMVSLLLPYLGMGTFGGNLRWGLLSLSVIAWSLTNLESILSIGVISPVRFLIGTCVCFNILSFFWSPFPFYTVMRGGSLFFLFLFLIGFINSINLNRKLLIPAWLITSWAMVLVLSGSILLVSGRANVPITGESMWQGFYKDRFCGILGNANNIGTVVSVCSPIVLALWWLNKKNIILFITLCSCLHSIVLAGSRAGLLGCCVGLALFTAVYLRLRFIPFIVTFGALVTILITIANENSKDALANYASHGEISEFQDLTIKDMGKNRLDIWTLGWESIKKQPILGQGYGIGGYGLKSPQGDDYGYPLHNSYLQIWQENGIIVIISIISILCIGFYSALNFTLHKSRGNKERILWAGFTGGFAGGVINATFESWMFSVGNVSTLPFWTCTLLLCSQIALNKGRRSEFPYQSQLQMKKATFQR